MSADPSATHRHAHLGCSAIYLAAMPDPHYAHRQDVVLDRVDDSVVANAHAQEAGSILQGARTRRPWVHR